MPRAIAILLSGAVCVLAACDAGNAVPPQTPTAGPGPTATPPQRGATGIATVDGVVAALLSGEPAGVRSVAGYVRVPCEVEPQGIGAPFQGAECEGYYLRPDEMDQTVQAMARLPLELYAAFEADGPWPEGDYVALFATDIMDRPEPDAVAATTAGGRMVGFHFGCAMTLESYLAFYRVTEFVLPPP